ncbi:MAG TPA: hypothetical protein ENN46_04625, partial [Candidatus Woesearchaeota archaeon]|nr:hypothetical protein [Candidatus Woesearchaeota archaeon]
MRRGRKSNKENQLEKEFEGLSEKEKKLMLKLRKSASLFQNEDVFLERLNAKIKDKYKVETRNFLSSLFFAFSKKRPASSQRDDATLLGQIEVIKARLIEVRKIIESQIED